MSRITPWTVCIIYALFISDQTMYSFFIEKITLTHRLDKQWFHIGGDRLYGSEIKGDVRVLERRVLSWHDVPYEI